MSGIGKPGETYLVEKTHLDATHVSFTAPGVSIILSVPSTDYYKEYPKWTVHFAPFDEGEKHED